MSDDLIERLQSVDIASVKRFSFDGLDILARIANIHDPDTYTIIFEYNGSMIKMNIRLAGLDAPELHSEVEAERKVCQAGVDVLNNMIGNKVARIVMGKPDKFGRILATVYTLDGLNINEFLLEKNFVRAYDGGRKGVWTAEELAEVLQSAQPERSTDEQIGQIEQVEQYEQETELPDQSEQETVSDVVKAKRSYVRKKKIEE